MAVKNITDSFISGQAVIELGFRLEDQSDITPIAVTEAIVKESIITEVINSPATYTYVIRTKTPDYVDKLLHAAMQNGTPRIRVRLGMVSGDNEFYLPWQEHQITMYKAIPFQDGHEIRMDTRDLMYTLTRTSQKVRARRGKVSDIVLSIAKENGLEAAVETTKSNGGEIYIQSNIDDADFIINRMLPRAINEQGRGNYRFFVKDNVLHFHSPDFQTSIRQLDYFNRSASTSIIFSDKSQINVVHGSAGVTAIVHDPYTGSSVTQSHNPANTLNFASVTPRINEVPGTDLPFTYHLGTNRIDEVVAMVQNRYETWYSSMYDIELQMERMPFVRLNDIVNILVRPDQAKTSPWSGLYSTVKVIHTIDNGALQSTFVLQRGEQASLGRNFQGLASIGIPDLVNRENPARGQLINAADIAEAKDVTSTSKPSKNNAGGEITKIVQPI